MALINILWLVLGLLASFLSGSIPYYVIIGRLATGKDLRRANPERDYVFAFNENIGKLERLFPEKK